MLYCLILHSLTLNDFKKRNTMLVYDTHLIVEKTLTIATRLFGVFSCPPLSLNLSNCHTAHLLAAAFYPKSDLGLYF